MEREYRRTTEYWFPAAAGMLLSFHAVRCLLGNFFSDWQMTIGSQLILQCILLVLLAVHTEVAYVTGHPRLVDGISAIVCTVGCAAYAWHHFAQLKLGGQALYTDYMTRWNTVFRTNYMGYDGERDTLAMTISFGVFMLLLMVWFLRILFGCRLFLLLPWLAVLFLGLLVNLKPGHLGLAFGFWEILVVCATPYDATQVCVRRKNQKKDKRPEGAMQSAHIVAVAVAGAAIVLIAGVGLRQVTAQIPVKSAPFLAFQKQVEEQVRQLNAFGVQFSRSQTSLNNATPEYHDTEILKLQSSHRALTNRAETNLYLKDFSSGTYNKSQWKSEGNTFLRSAKEAGYDAQELALLLQKLVKNYNVDDDADTTYTITYLLRGGRNAWTPYFSDLSDSGDRIRLESDRCVRKKSSCKTLTVDGFNHNLDTETYSYTILFRSEWSAQEQEMMTWYNQYAKEHYCGGSDQVPALDAYVEEVNQSLLKKFGIKQLSGDTSDSLADRYLTLRNKKAEVGDFVLTDDVSLEEVQAQRNKDVEEGSSLVSYLGEINSDNADAFYTNGVRIMLAEGVKSVLEKEAEYNLYLEDVPEGTDTVQYFLETGHEGYCKHFASAATLLLQEMGVPARYASGYVVKASAFTKEDESYTATVTDRNGHAWVEIYLDDVGWVPYEVTPGYADVGTTLPTDTSNTAKLQEKHEQHVNEENTQNSAADAQSDTESVDTQRTEETPTQAETEAPEASQNPDTGSASPMQNYPVWMRVLIMVLACAFLVLIGWEIYVQRTRREKIEMHRELRRRQYRRVALRMNRHIYRSLHRCSPKLLRLPRRKLVGHGWELRAMTDEEYLQKLMAAYPAIGGEDWRAFLQIVQKAAFSQEEITQDEVQFCYRIYRKL
jgi:hypothetical protein